jgi:uncharacterized protein (TIGR00255 family)
MIKSMTAYGRASRTAPIGRWVVEIHSVNRKMLDVHVHLPKEFLLFDRDVRKWVGEGVQRGQVTVRIFMQDEGQVSPHYAELLKDQKKNWEKIANELGYDPRQAVNLNFLVSQMHGLALADVLQEEDALRSSLKETVEEALEEATRMKEREGAALSHDILKRLKLIDHCIPKILERSSLAVERYREKLRERLREFSGAECDERILREVVLFAEKLDITEELTRLRSHLDQFYRLLGSDEKSVGRTLDFLTQEMHREINTLASKSSDAEVSFLAVTMKSELEKIREQIQNIE